jgi:hypothetical protein
LTLPLTGGYTARFREAPRAACYIGPGEPFRAWAAVASGADSGAETALAAIAGSGRTVSAASLKAGSINHASVLVSDMARSIDFYNRVFGLSVMNEDKENKISRLGI